MKVFEVVSLIDMSDFDKKGKALKLRSMYVNTNYGKPCKATAQTVTVKSTGKDGKIYGRRTLYQK